MERKTLQSGICLGFGSAFKISRIVKLKLPDSMPKSGNCDIVNILNDKGNIASMPSVNSQQIVTQPIQDDAKPTFITLQNNLLTSELPNNNINLGQELNDKENSLETVAQQTKVISFELVFLVMN